METFIVVRTSSPLFVAVCDWRFMGRELPDMRSATTLVVLLLGAAAYVQQDFTQLSLPAAQWCAAWLVVFCFDQLFIKHVCDTLPMTNWGRVLYSNALAIVPAIVLGAVFQEYGALRGYVWTRRAGAALALSCAIGVGMSYSAFLLRAQVSATTFTVVGILCKVGARGLQCSRIVRYSRSCAAGAHRVAQRRHLEQACGPGRPHCAHGVPRRRCAVHARANARAQAAGSRCRGAVVGSSWRVVRPYS